MALGVVAVLLVAFLMMGSSPSLSANDAANKAVSWIRQYIAAQGSDINVTLVNATQTGDGVYQFYVTMGTQTANYYVSNDGKLFFPQGFPTNVTASTSSQTTQTIPKSNTPSVQLYVMAFCPYGMQAEEAMKPVVDLLGSKADIQIHFIASVGGTTPDTVTSLHGTTEAQEDLRQVCIIKNYDQNIYWKYMMDINANCSASYSNAAAYETCWKSAAASAGIDASKITACANSTEGVNLVKADEQLSSANGASGSPTLIINGVTYSGARTPDAYKQAICSAFNTSPSECSQTLGNTTSTASGNCG